MAIKGLQQDNISLSSGIHRTPSLGDAGELSECVNLIPKAGELVTIPQPSSLGIHLDNDETLLAVHDTTSSRNFILAVGESEESGAGRKSRKKLFNFVSITIENLENGFRLTAGRRPDGYSFTPTFTFADGQTYTAEEITYGTTTVEYSAADTGNIYSTTNQVTKLSISPIFYNRGTVTAVTTYITYEGEQYDEGSIDITGTGEKINIFYFTDANSERIELFSAVIYSVSAMGNTLLFSTNEGMRYFVYSADEGYTQLDDTSFSFSAEVSMKKNAIGTAFKTAILDQDEVVSAAFGTYQSARLTASESRNFWSEVDTAFEVEASDEDEDDSDGEKRYNLKYVTPLTLALELYDGSYISFSNIAYIGHNDFSAGYDVHLGLWDGKGLVADAPSGGFPFLTANLTVQADFTAIKDIVRGIAVFTAPGINPYETDESKYVSLIACPTNGSGGRSGIPEVNPDTHGVLYENVTRKYRGAGDPLALWKVHYDQKKQKEYLRDLGDAIFYKSDFIPSEDFSDNGKVTIPLKRCLGVEESITLSDFGVKTYTSNILHVYNNRLHLANYWQNISGDKTSYIRVYDAAATGQPWHMTEGNVVDDFYRSISGGTEITRKKIDAVFVVNTKSRMRSEQYVFYSENLGYPTPSLFTLPLANVASLTIYLRQVFSYEEDGKKTTYYRYFSRTFSGFTTANGGDYSICQSEYGKMQVFFPNESFPTEAIPNELWSGTGARGNFEKYLARAATYIGVERPNQLIYTAEGNPFLFNHTVSVGDGSILGISTAAQALSQGQFGQFPLYVFSSDGIWSLEVGADGSYASRQPISRDVCTNPNAITQLDNAVAFVTEKGLMVISGSKVQKISDKVDGLNVSEDFFTPAVTTFATSLESDIPIVQDTAQFVRQIQDAQIVYDYANNLLHVYPSALKTGLFERHYVYSFDTGEWSTQACRFWLHTSVPSYPLSILQMENVEEDSEGGLFSYTNELSDEMQIGYALTRSNSFGNPLSRKMLADLRLVGQQTNDNTLRKVAIYVSNDNRHWQLLTSLKKLSVKYYRFLVMGYMHALDTLSGISVQYQERYTDKLR